MIPNNMTSDGCDREKAEKPIIYHVDKYQFVVTPVYRGDSGKTIHEILLELMKKDSERH